MNLTRILTEKYGFKDITWNHNNSVMETSVGPKKVTYWRDRNLLEYHLNFRDRLFSKSGIFCNRMIRTVDGNPYVQNDDILFTVHDVVDFPYLVQQDPEFKGFLLASLLAVGDELPYKNGEKSPFPYKETLKALQKVRQLNDLYYIKLVKMIPKVRKRLMNVQSMHPILYDGNEMKEVKGQFYYSLSDSPPQLAHHVVRTALHDYDESADYLQTCWSSLLSALPDHLIEQVKCLLILPWEWQDCVMTMQSGNEEDRYHRLEKEWEATLRICKLLELSVPARRTFSYE